MQPKGTATDTRPGSAAHDTPNLRPMGANMGPCTTGTTPGSAAAPGSVCVVYALGTDTYLAPSRNGNGPRRGVALASRVDQNPNTPTWEIYTQQGPG